MSIKNGINGGKYWRSIFLVGFCLFFYFYPAMFDAAIAQVAQEGVASGGDFWLWKFMGRLHPLAVHFPVSLLLFAAFLELFTIKNYQSKLRPGINLLVYF